MENEVIEVLEQISEKFGIAVDWSSKNVIPYLEELAEKVIRYKIVVSIYWVLIGIMLLGTIPIWKRVLRNYKIKYEKEKERAMTSRFYIDASTLEMIITIYTTCKWMCILVGILIIVFEGSVIIKGLILPESILFDMIKSLMK